jgi:dUTP pyrophosphatase
MIPVKIRMTPGARLPEYQSEGASGADLCAFLDEDLVIKKGAAALVPTGIYMEVPAGYEAQIRPRSGLSLKHGITVLNTPGTIDSDYRGEVKIILINLGSGDFAVTNGMRIAQMVFAKVNRGFFIEMEELASTRRDKGGFGHSGI